MHRITVQQAADIMNVSRRSVFMVMELEATGRADLLADVAAGRLTLLKALKMAKPEKYKVAQPKRLERLKGLWSLASNEERLEFLDWIIGRIESRSES